MPSRSSWVGGTRPSQDDTYRGKTGFTERLPINAQFPNGDVVAAIDDSGDVGTFVSEYMAYHVMWYRGYINGKYYDNPSKRCWFSVHTHVGVQVTAADAETCVKIQLDELIKYLP